MGRQLLYKRIIAVAQSNDSDNYLVTIFAAVRSGSTAEEAISNLMVAHQRPDFSIFSSSHVDHRLSSNIPQQ